VVGCLIYVSIARFGFRCGPVLKRIDDDPAGARGDDLVEEVVGGEARPVETS